MILSLCPHSWISRILCDVWGMEPQMWHFGLGAVSSVAGWIWHSGIDARWHGSIYHSKHQWRCWIFNGHVARTIPYRFCSSKRSCCIYQSYYFWHCYTSYTHKYKRYVLQKWVDNIRMDLQEVGCGYVDWIGLAQDRDRWRTLVCTVVNLQVPWNAGNFLTSCKPVSCSRRTLHHGVSK